MKNYSFVIFDLDGTLIDSVPDLQYAVNASLEKYDLTSISKQDIIPMIGNGVDLLLERALNKVGGDEVLNHHFSAFKMDYLQFYSENQNIQSQLYEGVNDTLEYFNKEHIAMVICTNKPYEFVEPILDKLNIKKFFNEWIGENSLAEKKPSGLPLQYYLEKYHIAKSDAVMVGDSKNDILAAKSAGIDSIGVSYGFNYHEPIASYEPTYTVNQFSEIKNIVCNK